MLLLINVETISIVRSSDQSSNYTSHSWTKISLYILVASPSKKFVISTTATIKATQLEQHLQQNYILATKNFWNETKYIAQPSYNQTPNAPKQQPF